MKPSPRREEAPAARAGPAALSRHDFARLAAFIEARWGIRLPLAKKALLETRLARRARELGMASLAGYCGLVLGKEPGDEHLHLIDEVTTNKTDFFREPHHFDELVGRVLPALAKRHGAGARRALRVWSAGCSTGEEPYTLAMVLGEAAGPGRPLAFEILGTDVSTRVLRRAREALYPESALLPVPHHLRRKYFLRSIADPGVVRAGARLRAHVGFRHLNLLDRDYPLGGPVDVVFCRNVFIYFERSVQEEVLHRFAASLVPGGFLFLGHAETLHGLDVPFRAVASTVYRRSEG